MGRRNITLLFLASVISRVGNSVYEYALIWMLVDRKGSAAEASYVMSLQFATSAIVGVAVGTLLDRANKKSVLACSDFLSGFTMTVLAYLAYQNAATLGVLLSAAFLLGAGLSVVKPAIRSLLPVVVAGDRLAFANSLIGNFSTIARIVGPMIGGYLILLPDVGIAAAFLVNGVTFFVSAACEASLQYREERQTISERPLIGEIRDGIGYIIQNRELNVMILRSTLVTMFSASFLIILPVFAKAYTIDGALWYSRGLSSYAFGCVCAMALFVRPRPTIAPRSLYPWMYGAASPFLMIATLPPNAGIPLAAWTLGCCTSIFSALLLTYLQKSVDASFIGRVFSVLQLLGMLVIPVSYLAFGHLGSGAPRYAALISALGIVMTEPLCWVWRQAFAVFKKGAKAPSANRRS